MDSGSHDDRGGLAFIRPLCLRPTGENRKPRQAYRQLKETTRQTGCRNKRDNHLLATLHAKKPAAVAFVWLSSVKDTRTNQLYTYHPSLQPLSKLHPATGASRLRVVCLTTILRNSVETPYLLAAD